MVTARLAALCHKSGRPICYLLTGVVPGNASMRMHKGARAAETGFEFEGAEATEMSPKDETEKETGKKTAVCGLGHNAVGCSTVLSASCDQREARGTLKGQGTSCLLRSILCCDYSDIRSSRGLQ